MAGTETKMSQIRARHYREIRTLVLRAFRENEWKWVQTSKQLGIPTSTLQKMMRRYPKLAALAARKRVARRSKGAGHE